MEISANYIPLGGVGDSHEFDQPMKKRDAGYRNKTLSAGKPKVIGTTKGKFCMLVVHWNLGLGLRIWGSSILRWNGRC